MRFRVGVVPPGGFRYVQAYLGGQQEITGDTIDHLSSNVLTFRSRLGIDIGDPLRDIDDDICRRFPNLCNQFDPAEGPGEADEGPQESLRKRLTNWRVNRYSQAQQRYTLEQTEAANKRAEVCSQCPANEDGRIGCPPCVVENDRVLFILRKGQATSSPVMACRITGQDNETAAFFPKEMLTYADKWTAELEEANPKCWLLPKNGLR